MDHLGTDRYEILTLLGRGGLGAVYAGRTRPAGVPVAFKTVEGVSQAPPHLEREYRVLSGLSHPNIVRVYETFTLNNKLWFAMEKIDGVSIDQVISQTANSRLTSLAASLFRQLQSALDYLHERRIVHAELSPSNLLVTDTGVLKLVDFEHCRLLELDESHYWPAGTVVGTPAYMAPEHLNGLPIIESDYFVVGTLLAEMVLGYSPFCGSSIGEILHMLWADFAPTIPDCADELREILRHLWAKEPAHRQVGWEMLRSATNDVPLTSILPRRGSSQSCQVGAHDSARDDEPLTHDMILRLHEFAIAVGLQDNRPALLAGFEPSIAAILPIMPEPGAQLLSDLFTLNRTRPLDGSTPILRWLTTAIALRPLQREADLFRRCRDLVQKGRAR